MKKTWRSLAAVLLFLTVLIGWAASAYAAEDGPANGMVVYRSLNDPALGSYACVTVTGLTPYVFSPEGAGSADAGDYTNVLAMAELYGEELGIVAAINGGIFYNAGTDTQYCFYYKEADGVVIADGVVLKSTESIDHTECDILVIDEDGGVGWADYYADADALAAGTGRYYDMYGNIVTGKKILSAVTGFVPIVIAGVSVYDPADELLSGYDNYVGHYGQSAVRQVFGVRDDGTCVILTNTSGWTLADAADVAVAQGCVFAYNLDGGGSAETVLAYHTDDGYNVSDLHSQTRGTRSMPTFLVFTASDRAPVSAVPWGLEAQLDEIRFSAGTELGDIARRLTVWELFDNADGGQSRRILYSRQGVDNTDVPVEHVVIGGASGFEQTEEKKQSVSPNGWLYYVKTDSDTALSLRNNANTRANGAYYDYSTGYTLTTDDDLTTPGAKTIRLSYNPGGGYDTLSTELCIMME